jgi:hypothetical protein
VPFDGESVHEVLMKHLTARPDLRGIPDPFRAIIEKALAKDPNHRPQHARDLLPPGEAPAPPELRFIPEDRLARDRPADEPIRIGPEEEPILYIGPNTMPPAPPRPRARGGWRRLVGGPPPAPARTSRPRRAAAPAPAQRPTPPARPAPPPPPEPPVMPPPRMRVAELTTSMLLATAFAAVGTVLAVPFFGLFGGPPPQDPGQLALLFGAVLLGSWGVLAPAKFWEGTPAGDGTRRLVMLAVGLGLGQLVAAASDWAHVALPSGDVPRGIPGVVQTRTGGEVPLLIGLAAFYGLAFGANRLWKLAARDRPHRFRLGPLVIAGLIAGLVGLPLEAPQPWGAVSLALVALVVQLASPWDRKAAAYAAYQRKLGKAGRRAA